MVVPTNLKLTWRQGLGHSRRRHFCPGEASLSDAYIAKRECARCGHVHGEHRPDLTPFRGQVEEWLRRGKTVDQVMSWLEVHYGLLVTADEVLKFLPRKRKSAGD